MSHPAIKSPDDVKKLGTILSVWAHPDDETFAAGGLVATAVDNGQVVACVTATKGEAGLTADEVKWPKNSLGNIRVEELHKALHILGCEQRHMFDYPDGGCSEVPSGDAVSKLLDLMNQYRPNTILTFGPDGITGHSDHITVGEWVKEAVQQLDYQPVVYHPVEIKWVYDKYMKAADQKFNIYFNIDEPPIKTEEDCEIYLELSNEIKTKKIKALTALESQTAGIMSFLSQFDLGEVFSVEAFVRAKL